MRRWAFVLVLLLSLSLVVAHGGHDEHVCTDSDNGRTNFVRGVVTVEYVDLGTTRDWEDACDDGVLLEAYCTPTGEGGYAAQQCDYGCSNGRCLFDGEPADEVAEVEDEILVDSVSMYFGDRFHVAFPGDGVSKTYTYVQYDVANEEVVLEVDGDSTRSSVVETDQARVFSLFIEGQEFLGVHNEETNTIKVHGATVVKVVDSSDIGLERVSAWTRLWNWLSSLF